MGPLLWVRGNFTHLFSRAPAPFPAHSPSNPLPPTHTGSAGNVGGSSGSSGSGTNLYLDKSDVSAIQTCSALTPARLSEALAAGDAVAQLYPRALLRVLVNIRDVRVIQYILTLLCDFLQTDLERRSRYLLLEHGELTLTSLLQLVGTTGSGTTVTSTDVNPYVLEYAARAASLLLSVGTPAGVAPPLASITCLMAWVQNNLRLFGSSSAKQAKVTEVRCALCACVEATSSLTPSFSPPRTPLPPFFSYVLALRLQVAVESLMILLRSDDLMLVFLSLDDSLPCLVALLATHNTQLLYDALHCLWLTSLRRANHGALERARAPLHVLRALRPGLPVKVLRVGLGLLVNLMKNAQCADTMALVVESAAAEAVLASLLGGAAAAAAAEGGAAAISDPELAEDARWAREAIAAKGGRFGPAFSNVERYVQELQAGVFHWTALHTPQFWKENARHFERDGCTLLKQLAKLITVRALHEERSVCWGAIVYLSAPPSHTPYTTPPSSFFTQNPDSEDVTIAVALFDAGEFASVHPQGRALAASTGLKEAVLLHLEAKRKSLDDVKQQALMAMSKLIRTA